MSGLPEGWAETPIGEIIDLNPKNTCDDSTEVGFVPMPLMGTTYLSKLGYERRQWREVKKGYTHFSDGDVLLGKITPCFENGKAGLASELPNALGAGSTEYFVCRPRPTLHPRYLLAYFKTRQFMSNGAVEMTGSVGHKRVPKDYVTETKIPLAPLTEQKRIADKLDSVLARVDACLDRLDRLPALLKRFRQSILAAATSGRLTEAWRLNQTNNSSSAELSCLLTFQEIKRQWLAQNGKHNEASRVRKRLESFKAKSVVNHGLPASWCWAALEDAVLMVVDCHNKTAPYESDGIPLVRTTNIRDGHFVWSDLRYVSEVTYGFWSKRCFPQPGDIVFTREAPMGEASIIPKNTKICLGQRTMLIRPLSEGPSENYLLIALLDPNFKERATETAVGTGVKHLRVGDVSELKLPLPPLSEQTEIVRRVEILFAFADRLEARLATARKQVDQLTPALLAKAFRGELVPQDPADEPAAELLKRLAAQREAAPKVKRGRAKA